MSSDNPFGRPAFPTFRVPTVTVPRPAHFADTTFERIEASMKAFEDSIAPDEEVGAMMAHFGQQVTIAVSSIGFRNPFLITFHGTVVSTGERCTLVQHMNQVSLLLVALKAKDPEHPRRIGFTVDDTNRAEPTQAPDTK